MCPGATDLAGYGKVAVTAAGWTEDSKGSKLQVTNISDMGVTVFTNARAYFANTCEETSYDHRRYLALNLLGKKMRYTTDISGTGCGCNAALYLVSMPQNENVSDCGDYYCDANAVCGKFCSEIDIQEANQHAWHSTLHSSHDRNGLADGYGGGGANWTGPRSFTPEQYSPGGQCVDTSKPFNVTVSFPVDSKGSLTAMVVELSQEGDSCSLEIKLSSYNGMRELEQALIQGMTPVISYWHSKDMLWMDGMGADGKGPCTKDRLKCAESIRFYDFAVVGPGGPESLMGESAKRFASVTSTSSGPVPTSGMHGKDSDGQRHNGSSLRCARSTDDCRTVACCSDPGMQCYEQSRYWSGCRESCTPDFSADGWTCKRLGARTPQGGWHANHPLPGKTSTTSSQGGGFLGTSGTTIHKEKGETSQTTGAVVSDRDSHSSSSGSHSISSSLMWLGFAALVVSLLLAAVAWWVRRESTRDLIMAMHSDRPHACNPCPGERWKGPGRQPDPPLVRAPQTFYGMWDAQTTTTTTQNTAFREEEEPASTWQQLQGLFSGCSMSSCNVGCVRSGQMDAIQQHSRPRTASTMTLYR